MKRIKFGKTRLPDAIYRRSKKDGNFTMAPNTALDNPDINGWAFRVLVKLLSNKIGWITYENTLKETWNVGALTIKGAMRNLRENGYVINIRYRDKSTKEIKGSFLVATDTPYHFEYHRNKKILEKAGLEIIPPKTQVLHRKVEKPENGLDTPLTSEMEMQTSKPQVLHRKIDFPSYGKPITNNIKIIIKKKPNDLAARLRRAAIKEEEEEIIEEKEIQVKECPWGYKYGIDTEEHKECERCILWKGCMEHKQRR